MKFDNLEVVQSGNVYHLKSMKTWYHLIGQNAQGAFGESIFAINGPTVRQEFVHFLLALNRLNYKI